MSCIALCGVSTPRLVTCLIFLMLCPIALESFKSGQLGFLSCRVRGCLTLRLGFASWTQANFTSYADQWTELLGPTATWRSRFPFAWMFFLLGKPAEFPPALLFAITFESFLLTVAGVWDSVDDRLCRDGRRDEGTIRS